MYNIPTSGLGDSFEGLTEPKPLAAIGMGALQGAAAGSVGGVAGSVLGGVIGAGVGMFNADQAKEQYNNDLVRQQQAKQASAYMKQRQQGLSALDSVNAGQAQQRIGYLNYFNF